MHLKKRKRLSRASYHIWVSKMSPELTQRLVEWLRTTADNLLKNEADQYAAIFKARLMK